MADWLHCWLPNGTKMVKGSSKGNKRVQKRLVSKKDQISVKILWVAKTLWLQELDLVLNAEFKFQLIEMLNLGFYVQIMNVRACESW